jgi:hypothetical protein
MRKNVGVQEHMINLAFCQCVHTHNNDACEVCCSDWHSADGAMEVARTMYEYKLSHNNIVNDARKL